jgi:hypothetical protein
VQQLHVVDQFRKIRVLILFCGQQKLDAQVVPLAFRHQLQLRKRNETAKAGTLVLSNARNL